MIKINARDFYRTFTTNSGLCLLVQLITNEIVFVTSDMKVINEQVLKFDFELGVGRQFTFHHLLYEISEIRTDQNLTRGLPYKEIMLGKIYDYNFMLILIVKLVI